jgi:Fe-S oxidoreductase/nitrate reductase gamma subunit
MIFGYHDLPGAYDVPMRVVGANIQFEWLIYLLMPIPIGILLYGAYKKISVWWLAKGKLVRWDQMGKRIWSFIVNIFLQKQVVRKPIVGFMHGFLFWGFLFLAITTASFAMWDKIGIPPLEGNVYIGISFLADILGFLALIGIAVLGINRYILKPSRLNDTKPLDGWVIALIFVILFTGYLIEGARIAAQMINEINAAGSLEALGYEKFASPIGWLTAYAFQGSSLESVLLWHRILWWFHMAIAFLFIGMLPFTKLWHIITSMIAYFVRDLGPSSLRMVDNIEEAETFGVENLEDFTWKDLMDLDACIRCGRCQEVCPAYNTGKPLNPKVTLIQSMKNHMDAKGPYLLETAKIEDENMAMTTDGSTLPRGLDVYKADGGDPTEVSLIYDVVTPDVIWGCTNCRACVEHCPMFIEHIDKIAELRRNLVMWQGDMSSEAQAAFSNMERNYNPWGVGWANRAEWLKERNVRDLVNLIPEDGQEFEYLLYGGCAVAFDDRFKRVGEAVIRILNEAGVSFGYLGTEEQCCGDSARRLGNEYLYQTLAKQNIETFKQYGVKKIICICPHGYNALKNEYPQLGADFKVYHYTEILSHLIATDKIHPDRSVKTKMAYHDSCFLGRHNHIYDAPRLVIEAAGAEIVEIDKSREFGFCCGAGGGRMWLEEEAVEGFKRINETRTDQLLKAKTNTIVTNCPFCLTMIDDGVKGSGKEEDVKVIDVAEILWRNIKRN